LLLPFLFEFWYLPTTLTSETTSVALAEVAGRITVLLVNRALGYSYPFAVFHLFTSLLYFLKFKKPKSPAPAKVPCASHNTYTVRICTAPCKTLSGYNMGKRQTLFRFLAS